MWRKHIRPKDKFIFQLWFPDVAMQFLSSNIYIAVTRELYLINDQKIKEKYGFNANSYIAGKNNDLNHVDGWGLPQKNFKEEWGFSYENSLYELPLTLYRYKNTLVEKFYNHDCRKGPIKIWKKN